MAVTLYKLLFGFAILFFTYGCDPFKWAYLIQPTPTIPESEETKIGARIGVFYSANFKEHRAFARAYKGYSYYKIEVGQASVRLFDAVLERVFKDVIPLNESISGSTKLDKELDGIIELSLRKDSNSPPRGMYIVSSDIHSSLLLIHQGRYFADIIYNIRFYSSQGKRISTFDVKGKGNSPRSIIEKKNLTIAVNNSMEDAAKKFRSAFLRQPNVQRWLLDLRDKKEEGH